MDTLTQSMNITSARYITLLDKRSIYATIDGYKVAVPLDENNRHYIEIMRKVEAGDLVIESAEE